MNHSKTRYPAWISKTKTDAEKKFPGGVICPGIFKDKPCFTALSVIEGGEVLLTRHEKDALPGLAPNIERKARLIRVKTGQFILRLRTMTPSKKWLNSHFFFFDASEESAARQRLAEFFPSWKRR